MASTPNCSLLDLLTWNEEATIYFRNCEVCSHNLRAKNTTHPENMVAGYEQQQLQQLLLVPSRKTTKTSHKVFAKQ